MKPRAVWFDIDMVLADTVRTVVDLTSKLTGLRILNHEPPAYDEVWKCLETQNQFDVARAIQTIKNLYELNPAVYATALPIDGSIEITKFLHQKFMLGGYISARHSNFHNLTRGWLDMWGFPHAPLYCIGSSEAKIRTLNLEGASFIVEDSGEFVQRLATGADCMTVPILIERSYNQNHREGVKTIRTLFEIPALLADN